MSHYHIELYDKKGRIVSSCGALDVFDAFLVLARRITEQRNFDFSHATCYRNQEVYWEVEVKL